MSNSSDPFDRVWSELADLLRVSETKPTLHTHRIARSFLYDAWYHMSIVSCAFNICGKQEHGSTRMHSQRLKLVQFLAARPQLVAPFRRWLNSEGSEGSVRIESWSMMPRGYLLDKTHDSTIEYLLAIGELSRHQQDLVQPHSAASFMEHLFSTIKDIQIFESERRVLNELASVRIPQRILGGP
jgi:hypothetical protein